MYVFISVLVALAMFCASDGVVDLSGGVVVLGGEELLFGLCELSAEGFAEADGGGGSTASGLCVDGLFLAEGGLDDAGELDGVGGVSAREEALDGGAVLGRESDAASEWWRLRWNASRKDVGEGRVLGEERMRRHPRWGGWGEGCGPW